MSDSKPIQCQEVGDIYKERIGRILDVVDKDDRDKFIERFNHDKDSNVDLYKSFVNPEFAYNSMMKKLISDALSNNSDIHYSNDKAIDVLKEFIRPFEYQLIPKDEDRVDKYTIRNMAYFARDFFLEGTEEAVIRFNESYHTDTEEDHKKFIRTLNHFLNHDYDRLHKDTSWNLAYLAEDACREAISEAVGNFNESYHKDDKEECRSLLTELKNKVNNSLDILGLMEDDGISMREGLPAILYSLSELGKEADKGNPINIFKNEKTGVIHRIYNAEHPLPELESKLFSLKQDIVRSLLSPQFFNKPMDEYTYVKVFNLPESIDMTYKRYLYWYENDKAFQHTQTADMSHVTHQKMSVNTEATETVDMNGMFDQQNQSTPAAPKI